MSDEHWSVDYTKSFMVFLNGEAIPSRGPTGERVVDDSFLVLFNAHYAPLDFVLPNGPFGNEWARVIDTRTASIEPEDASHVAGEAITLEARSLVVMKKTG
jgi:glycogen operon protein